MNIYIAEITLCHRTALRYILYRIYTH